MNRWHSAQAYAASGKHAGLRNVKKSIRHGIHFCDGGQTSTRRPIKCIHHYPLVSGFIYLSDQMSYRVLLPDDVIPSSYDLALEPDLERYTFDGVVAIHCDVQVATDVITLHARELTITEATYKAEGGSSMEVPASILQYPFLPESQNACNTCSVLTQAYPMGHGQLGWLAIKSSILMPIQLLSSGVK